jgi:putative ABC transport system substrate-binding protein
VAARRAFLAGLAAAAVVPRAARASEAGRRIGVLSAGNPRSAPHWVAFEERLRELGHAEGAGLALDFRDALGRVERMGDLAAELAARQPRVLVAGGPEATLRAVRQAAGTLPIVMIAIDYDPVALGHVGSLARPAGNVTGLFFRNIELTGKRLQLLAEVLPGLMRVAVFWDGFSADQFEAAQAAARTLRLQVVPRELGDPPYDFEAAFRAVARERAGALLGLASPLLFRERARVAELAIRHRLPGIHTASQYAEAGAFMSYGVSFRAMFRRAAEYVDRLLKGARPSELPIEQPSSFELVINLRTARALGVAVPTALRLRADALIE